MSDTIVHNIERRPMPLGAGLEKCRRRLLASRAALEEDRAKLPSDEQCAADTLGERRARRLATELRYDLGEREKGLEACIGSFNRDARLARRQELVIQLMEGR